MKDKQIEHVDLVDQFDSVVGQIPITDIYKMHLQNTRAVNIFIQNKNGDLWIPRRHQDKSRWPNTLDFSVSGHVSSGESYIEGALREIKEEILIDINKDNLHLLEIITPHSHAWSPCFCAYFLIHRETIDCFNLTDFYEANWISPRNLVTILTNPNEKEGKPALIHAVRYFFKVGN